MRNSKFLLTSLLAAATMSVPAFAWTTGADGLPDTNGISSPQTTIAADHTVTADTIYNFTDSGEASSVSVTLSNGADVKLNAAAAGTGTVMAIGSISGTGDVWFARGRWRYNAASTFTSTGTIYMQGGQFWVTGQEFTTSNDVVLGSSTFSESTANDAGLAELNNSALRVGSNVTLNGTTTVVENAKIGFQGDANLTIGNLTGSGNITTGAYGNSASTLTVSDSSSFTGTIELRPSLSLTWSSPTATFGGLSGNGSVTGGSYLNIKDAQNTTFSGTVGSSTSRVALALTGTGAQSFTGTSYFSTVSVADTAALTLGGTVSLANTVSVFGSGSVSVNDSVIFILNDSYKADNTWTLISGASSVDGWSRLTPDNFRKADGSFFIGRSEINVGTSGAVTITEGTPASLVWNGTSENSTWNTSTTNKNWTNNNLSSEDKADSFYTLDNVTFKSLENVFTTVTLENGADLTVGEMKVTGDSSYIVDVSANGNTATIAGAKLTIDSGSTLQVGQSAGGKARNVKLNFDSISLGGTLKLQTKSTDSWGALMFASEGAHLHIYDIGGSDTNAGLSIDSIVMDAAGKISSDWGKLVTIGSVSGSANLTIESPSAPNWVENIVYRLSDLTNYTGTLSTTAGTGTGTLTVEISGNFGGVIDVNAGTLKMMSSAVLGGTVNINDGGTVNLTGTETNHTATFKVNAGGTLKVTGHDSFKYDDADGGIVMTGAEGNLAKFIVADKSGNSYASMTLSKNITLQGNTLVSSEGGASFNTYGGKVTATGTNNTISSEIKLRRAFTVEVTNLGDMLEISGALTKHSDGNNGFKKTGNGVLKLSGRNNYDCLTTIEAGRLVAASSSALGSGKTTVESGAELGLVAGTAVTVTNGIDLESGAKLVVDLSSKASATETFTLDLVSGTALKYSGVTFEEDCTSLITQGIVVLENMNLAGWTQSLSYLGNTLQLTLTIPEPSTFGLLAGLGALALAGTRRRRKKA